MWRLHGNARAGPGTEATGAEQARSCSPTWVPVLLLLLPAGGAIDHSSAGACYDAQYASVIGLVVHLHVAEGVGGSKCETAAFSCLVQVAQPGRS